MRPAYLIDTNLLVLLVVGATSEAFIAVHKRTRAYAVEDFRLLRAFLAEADRLVLTSNVLTETSNLVRQFEEPGRSRILETYRGVVRSNPERYVSSLEASARSTFAFLGLADAVLTDVGLPNATLITADFKLYQAALRAGRPAVNFAHARERLLRQ